MGGVRLVRKLLGSSKFPAKRLSGGGSGGKFRMVRSLGGVMTTSLVAGCDVIMRVELTEVVLGGM